MKAIFYVSILVLLLSCGNGEPESDAYGNFTAKEVIVSAESSGRILASFIEEGQSVDVNDLALVVDTVQSNLKLLELKAKRRAVLAKKLNVQAQVEVLEEQKKALLKDLSRFEKMFGEGSASEKQVDDLQTRGRVLEKQISQVQTNFRSIAAEADALEAGINQVEDLLNRARVKIPIPGTILETYAETGELVAPGKPLFKIANLQTIELKAYFGNDQLSQLKIGDEVEVLSDASENSLKSHKGVVSWISSQAEFTPKVIQTREERISLVYAVKIKVENDGSLHINMPGEVRLLKNGKSQ